MSYLKIKKNNFRVFKILNKPCDCNFKEEECICGE